MSREEAVTDEIARCARDIELLTGRCGRATAEALDDIDRQLRAITADARRSITGMREQLAATSGPDAQTEISRAFANQQEAASGYVTGVDRLCDLQDELAAAAVDAVQECSAIIEAGQTITTVSRASRLLSLNAATSAARIGARGAAVGVIANQMQSLSDEIQEVNRDLQGLVTSLMSLLPRVVHQAADIRAASRGFAAELEAGNARLAEDTAALDSALKVSVDEADRRLRAVVVASRRGVSELSFRSRFDGHLAQLQQEANGLLERVSYHTGEREAPIDAGVLLLS